MIRNISDEQLAEFAEWYFKHFECVEASQVCFCISMAGYLHSYEKEVKQLFKRCQDIGLVTVHNGIVKKGGVGHG